MATSRAVGTRRLMLLAGGVIALLVVLAGSLQIIRGQARTLDDFGAAPAFALTDQFERPVSSTDYAGRVVVASFIYTNCRDICPALSLRMKSLQERLQQERLLGGRVQMLSFTVDPARDTPDVLRAYAERHGAAPDGWRFLTGPEDVLVPLIVDGFRLGVEALPPAQTGGGAAGGDPGAQPYEVTHSGRFVLIDRRGRVRAYYYGTDVDLDQVVRDIKALLR